jgi:hypothetical protein
VRAEIICHGCGVRGDGVLQVNAGTNWTYTKIEQLPDGWFGGIPGDFVKPLCSNCQRRSWAQLDGYTCPTCEQYHNTTKLPPHADCEWLSDDGRCRCVAMTRTERREAEARSKDDATKDKGTDTK